MKLSEAYKAMVVVRPVRDGMPSFTIHYCKPGKKGVTSVNTFCTSMDSAYEELCVFWNQYCEENKVPLDSISSVALYGEAEHVTIDTAVIKKQPLTEKVDKIDAEKLTKFLKDKYGDFWRAEMYRLARTMDLNGLSEGHATGFRKHLCERIDYIHNFIAAEKMCELYLDYLQGEEAQKELAKYYDNVLIWEGKKAQKEDVSNYVSIPGGGICCEKKECSDYPGVFVFVKDKFGNKDIAACVEYNPNRNEIMIETYCALHDDPVNIICYSDGHDLNH